MSSERRDTYRIQVDPNAESAILKIGNTELIVHLLEKSSGGFGVLVDPDSAEGKEFQQGQSALMRAIEGCYDVEISRVELYDGQVRLGLKRLSDLRTQSRYSGGSWGSLAPGRLLSNTFNVMKVLVIFMVCSVLAAWGLSYSSQFLRVEDKPQASRTAASARSTGYRPSGAAVSVDANDPVDSDEPQQQRRRRLIAELTGLNELKTPQSVQRLNLTSAQRLRVSEIIEKTAAALSQLYRSDAQADPDNLTEKGLQWVREAQRQIEELLTEEQNKLWEAWRDNTAPEPELDQQAGAN